MTAGFQLTGKNMDNLWARREKSVKGGGIKQLKK